MRWARRQTAYVLVRAVVSFFRVLPRGSALAVGGFIGGLLPFVAPRERRLAEKHLSLAFGDSMTPDTITRTVRGMFRNLALNFVDTVRIAVMTPEEVIDVCVPHGMDNFREAHSRGNGVVNLSSHAGCWEMMGTYLAATGMDLHVVAKKLYDPRLEELLDRSRADGGMKVISRGNNTRDIIRALKSGGAVGMLVDQDIKVRGVFVDFFGRPAHTSTAPAMLSLRYGAPIVPFFTYRDGMHRHHVCVGDEVRIEPTGDTERDILDLTARCAKVTEDFIREHPDQWVWFHRRWKTRPEAQQNGGG